MDSARGPSPFRRPVSSSPGAAAVGLLPSTARRSLSRHAGRRKQARFLNSLLVHSIDQFADLTEEELQSRLDHMVVKVVHRPVFEPLQRPENRDILRAFRSGALAERHLVDEKPRPDASRFSTISLRSALQGLYARVDRGLRPLLLGEVRRALVSGDAVPFVTGLELTMQRLMSGHSFDGWWSPEAVGSSLFERTARPPSGPSLSGQVSLPARRGGGGSGVTEYQVLALAFRDGTARMVCEAIAQCYGFKYTKSEVAGAVTTATASRPQPAESEARGRRGRGGAEAPAKAAAVPSTAPAIAEWVIELSFPVLQRWDEDEAQDEETKVEEEKEEDAAAASTPVQLLRTPAGLPHPLVLTHAVRQRLQRRVPEGEGKEDEDEDEAELLPAPLLGLLVRALSGGGVEGLQ